MPKSPGPLHHPTSCTHHRGLRLAERQPNSFIWEKTVLSPFDELIISWSAARPHQGHYIIQASVFTTHWTPWIDYALWGTQRQLTFSLEGPELRTHQDTVEVLQGHQATGFKIRILAEQGATLNEFRALHVCTTLIKAHGIEAAFSKAGALTLDLPGLSQMALPDSHAKRLCSPSSLTAVIRYLLGTKTPCPLQFAAHTHDAAFDIYGNWVLNTAQAAHELGGSWTCFVTRFSTLDELVASLHCGIPIVVSVQGSLTGAPLPYASGHLLVVRGYAPATQNILCMDPAFSCDSQTLVGYHWKEFRAAWNRRKGLAYSCARVVGEESMEGTNQIA